jgi:hypothetical protein
MDPKSLDPDMVRFLRWCAGYLSGADPSERMPTDVNDLLRIFEYVQHEDGRTLIRAALMVTAPLVPEPGPVP